MKLTKFTVLFLLLSFVVINTANAQVKTTSKNWKSPTFTIDVAPSFVLPVQESKGSSIGEFFSFKNYGTKVGFGAMFNFKFGLGKEGQYRPYLTLGYSQMQGKDNNTAFIGNNIINSRYPFQGDSIPTSGPGSSEIILRIPHIGAGFEYAITNADKKKRMWYPFFGVEFLASVVTGIYRQTSTNAPSANTPGVETGYTIKSDLRVGIGAGMGAAFRFGKYFGMSVGGKYKLFNLIGKKSDALNEVNKMNILDKAAVDLNSNLAKDRNMGSIELYLALTIYMGKTKK